MAILKRQIWRPDTHPGHSIETEWEYDPETRRDTGREHRGVAIRYPDGTYIHRDTHGPEIAHRRYLNLLAEHVVKNQAMQVILETLPDRMKKPMLDSDGDAILDAAGQSRLVVKKKHWPSFTHLGNGRYEFTVPGIDEAARGVLVANLAQFGAGVVSVKS